MKIRLKETRSPQGKHYWTIESKTGLFSWSWLGTFYDEASANQAFNERMTVGFCKDYIIREAEAPES